MGDKSGIRNWFICVIEHDIFCRLTDYLPNVTKTLFDTMIWQNLLIISEISTPLIVTLKIYLLTAKENVKSSAVLYGESLAKMFFARGSKSKPETLSPGEW